MWHSLWESCLRSYTVLQRGLHCKMLRSNIRVWNWFLLRSHSSRLAHLGAREFCFLATMCNSCISEPVKHICALNLTKKEKTPRQFVFEIYFTWFFSLYFAQLGLGLRWSTVSKAWVACLWMWPWDLKSGNLRPSFIAIASTCVKCVIFNFALVCKSRLVSQRVTASFWSRRWPSKP